LADDLAETTNHARKNPAVVAEMTALLEKVRDGKPARPGEK